MSFSPVPVLEDACKCTVPRSLPESRRRHGQASAVNWLRSLSLAVSGQTTQLGYQIFDRFLKKNDLPPSMYWLGLAASLRIASKHCESASQQCEQLSLSVSPDDFLAVELTILSTLNWSSTFPTALETATAVAQALRWPVPSGLEAVTLWVYEHPPSADWTVAAVALAALGFLLGKPVQAPLQRLAEQREITSEVEACQATFAVHCVK